MAFFVKDKDLFCPHCKNDGDLWISPTRNYEVTCKKCKRVWGRAELSEICIMVGKRAEEVARFQYWAACLRILMQHTINPYTGRRLA
jgi:uncharacterized protein YbaR (Trm112 family)